MIASRQHGAAADHNAGNVESGCRHQHPRHHFITVGNQDQPVKSRSHGYRLNGVSDEFPTGQRVFHPRMSHRNAVAYADSRKFKGRSPGGHHTQLGCRRDIPQMNVPGNHFVKGITDADQRFCQIFRAISHGMEQGTMRTSSGTFFYNIASHIRPILS